MFGIVVSRRSIGKVHKGSRRDMQAPANEDVVLLRVLSNDPADQFIDLFGL